MPTLDTIHWRSSATTVTSAIGVSHVSASLAAHVAERRDPASGEARPVTSDDEASLLLNFGDGEATERATGVVCLSMAEAGRPEVLLVDPPRAGLSQKIVRRVIEAAPERIVYVSCNPTTLAPNAAQLVEAGYELRRVRPVDMFPQTPHIECVAELARATAANE